MVRPASKPAGPSSPAAASTHLGTGPQDAQGAPGQATAPPSAALVLGYDYLARIWVDGPLRPPEAALRAIEPDRGVRRHVPARLGDDQATVVVLVRRCALTGYVEQVDEFCPACGEPSVDRREIGQPGAERSLGKPQRAVQPDAGEIVVTMHNRRAGRRRRLAQSVAGVQ